ncbi:mercuric ion transporter MerT [Pseudoduganella eburnea]|uniref:Mercuric transport protein MerT n=1 Tax=Massilia eburnea TaxID=1776165 RepID=A0A6L6QE14_9BURK|nr:mercuric ion transporter MerT [Massilia eburnea]MTW10602.1 mercuric ion transporter MerT [Massilia eburnea]
MKLKTPTARSALSGRIGLFSAGVAAILASSCCLGPLVLLMLGVSGAWIGNLTLLEPYRLYFVGLSFIALAGSWRRIWRPASSCETGEVCATTQVQWSYRVLFIMVAVLLFVALSFPWIAPWFY